jgi:hypothetical protein
MRMISPHFCLDCAPGALRSNRCCFDEDLIVTDREASRAPAAIALAPAGGQNVPLD